MLFNSYIFMFVFLPVVWGLYAISLRLSWRLASPVLAAASLFFYGWWDSRFLPLLIMSILVNFLLGRRIETANAANHIKTARFWLIVGIVGNLGALGFFKYANFFLENVSTLAGEAFPILQVVLPIGISFFTFQQIAYLVDVRQGKSDRYRLMDYAVFVAFFPQLIAGPIVHHREMMPQFMGGRRLLANDVAIGIAIFVAGLFKKVVIADNLSRFASPVFIAADSGADVTTIEAWGGVLAYTFQIYFDFSGYCDMAIGLGRMFGIRLPVNFYSPYKAGSIVEFWRCWHITLSRFLRDYLYIPLGGNRYGRSRRYGNLITTMVLGGLWHGAGWGFVIWGALHGAYLCVNHALQILAAHNRVFAVVTRQRWLGWLLTFFAVVIAWVFFRATSLDGALTLTEAMFGLDGISFPANYAKHFGSLPIEFGFVYAHESHIDLRDWALFGVPFIFCSALIAFIAPNTAQIFLSEDSFYSAEVKRPEKSFVPTWEPSLTWAAVISLILVISVLFASTISEFLYFQF